MPSPWKKQPEDVVDSVLRRVEVRKIARRLQNRLALAQFKFRQGWEDLTLDSIEPKMEAEIRRKKLYEGDVLSDSSSSDSGSTYPTSALMSSPFKAPLFSDVVGSSNGGTGHRKRAYITSFDQTASSPRERTSASPTLHKSFSYHAAWRYNHQLAQSSPIKPLRRQHFTTSAGPDVSFFRQRRMANELLSPNFAAVSDDEEDILPAHSFSANNLRSSPPRTPPMQTPSLPNKKGKENNSPVPSGKTGDKCADLLFYMAASSSPPVKANLGRMERLTTPPPLSDKPDLPSSMLVTPGGCNLFPNTPGQEFDLADFVNITPSPAQRTWRGPETTSVTTHR